MFDRHFERGYCIIGYWHITCSLGLCVFIWLMFLHNGVSAQSFAHPGILHSGADLERMKTAVTAQREPIYAGYQVFAVNPASQYTYSLQGPLEMVGRNPTVGQSAYDNDANAAYQNAVMWAITRDKRHADKAIEIINAWTATLKFITGRDAVLMAGLGPFKMISAAEIIRYTQAGWQDVDIRRAERHFNEVVYPVIESFAPFANGNWDAAAIKTAMAIGVFCNDRRIFESALCYYVNGWGNGSLRNYVINEQGQVQESGRDQPHSQLGIGMLAECCAIAWNQGLDLYGYDDNRLLKGFEYVAKFNLGHDDMPFSEWLDRTGKYHHTRISQQGRGNLRAVYEQVYNHYVVLKGIAAPFVKIAAEKLRPEGPGTPGADHPGYGTLFFSLPDPLKNSIPAAPSGLVVTGTPRKNILTWVPATNAHYYTVKRADRVTGPFIIISQNITDNKFTDKKVKKGKLYYYTVTASNTMGESTGCFQRSVTAGLPGSWQQADIGKLPVGNTEFDGNSYVINSNGTGVDSTADSFHYTYFPLQGDGILTVRFTPQPSSQFSRMGLMLRGNIREGAQLAALMMFPGNSGQVEAPDWHTRFLIRSADGSAIMVKRIGELLRAPSVTYGRLTGYYWLRLERTNNTCSGFVSYDGVKWTEAGVFEIDAGSKYLLGIVVGSGMPNATTVRFDNISVNGKSLTAN